jgi:hypothetical protein
MRPVPAAEVRVIKASDMNNLSISRSVSGWFAPVCFAVAMLVAGGAAWGAGEQADREDKADRDSESDGDKGAAREGKAGSGERDASGKPGQAAPRKLSFTDEDLKKYHRADDSEGSGEDAAVLEEPESGTGGEAAPQQAPPVDGAPPNPPAAGTAATDAAASAAASEADPLKEFREREAREKERKEKVDGQRERIAALESRLNYLQERRLAIIDPLRIMPMAQTSDDRKQEGSAGAAELLKAVEEEIVAKEAELRTAREELVATETSFAPESR